VVNIHDFGPQETAGDKLSQIFERQTELMEKYHVIEAANGFWIAGSSIADLNNAKFQYRLKDFAWRIIEELGEALEALGKGQDVHTNEEIADALHFLVELSIMVGYKPSVVLETLYILWEPEGTAFMVRKYSCIAYRVGVVVEKLGVTMNCLKNKPWKQTHMLTDQDYFMENMTKVWGAFIQLCITAKITENELYDLYFRKSEVNKFRQRSEY
jgi:hypothetical protein